MCMLTIVPTSLQAFQNGSQCSCAGSADRSHRVLRERDRVTARLRGRLFAALDDKDAALALCRRNNDCAHRGVGARPDV